MIIVAVLLLSTEWIVALILHCSRRLGAYTFVNGNIFIVYTTLYFKYKTELCNPVQMVTMIPDVYIPVG